MCIQKLISRPKQPDIKIFVGGDAPYKPGVVGVKEPHESVVVQTLATIEPIGVEEPYRQIGEKAEGQLTIRQSLLDTLVQPEFTGQHKVASGYIVGRLFDGGVVADGMVYVRELDHSLLRLNGRRTAASLLQAHIDKLEATVVGTFSFAQYDNMVITEDGLSEKIVGLPHIFILDKETNSPYKELAIVTPVHDGWEVHGGVRIVDHANSIKWGIVPSVAKIVERPIEIRLL